MEGVITISHDHRLSRWLAQPYKGMLPAGLKDHRKFDTCKLALPPQKWMLFQPEVARLAVTEGVLPFVLEK